MPLLSEIAALIQKNAQALEAELAAMNGGAAPDLSIESVEPAPIDVPPFIPTARAFGLMEALRADLRALESAFTPTKEKHARIALASFKTQALHVAVELGLSDAIDAAGGEVDIKDLARTLGVHPNKLGNVMRILACEHIYVERRPGVFANSRHSLALRDESPGARAMLSFMTGETYEATGALYKNLADEKYRYDFSPENSPFGLSVGKGKSFNEYLGDHPDVVEKVILGVVPWLNVSSRSPWRMRRVRSVTDSRIG